MSISILIPLGNFDLDSVREIHLNDAKIIQSVNYKEIYDKFNIESPKYSLPKYSLFTSIDENEVPRRVLDRILEIFKIYKEGLILSSSVIFGDFNNIDKIRIDKPPHYVHYVDKDRGMPEFHLSDNEIESFIEFWNEFKNIDYNNFALYKFHLADFEPYSRDILVNYVECIEFLLVPDSSDGEIAFKFRSRGTIILGLNKTIDERKGIYLNLKSAYDLRSAIVHGNQKIEEKLLKNKTWEDFHCFLRDYVRHLIQFFFKNGCLDDYKKRKELIENVTIFEHALENTDS